MQDFVIYILELKYAGNRNNAQLAARNIDDTSEILFSTHY